MCSCEKKFLQSNVQEELDRPNFTVQLKTVQCDRSNEISDFKFQCSSEQIQVTLEFFGSMKLVTVIGFFLFRIYCGN